MPPQLRHIPEAEYTAYHQQCLLDLAREIARSGFSLSEIARGCRMKWDTVYAASQGRSVRVDNMFRIMYFLRSHNRETTENGHASNLTLTK